MARKKLKIKTTKTSKGRKNLQAKAASKETVEKKKPGRKPGKAKVTKQIVGYNLMKRDESAVVKAYADLEKKFEEFAEALNEFCYENGDKIASATKTNKAVLAFGKETTAFKSALKKAKSGLKPIYQ